MMNHGGSGSGGGGGDVQAGESIRGAPFWPARQPAKQTDHTDRQTHNTDRPVAIAATPITTSVLLLLLLDLLSLLRNNSKLSSRVSWLIWPHGLDKPAGQISSSGRNYD